MEIIVVPDIHGKALDGMDKVHVQHLLGKPQARTPALQYLVRPCVMLAVGVVVKVAALADADTVTVDPPKRLQDARCSQSPKGLTRLIQIRPHLAEKPP